MFGAKNRKWGIRSDWFRSSMSSSMSAAKNVLFFFTIRSTFSLIHRHPFPQSKTLLSPLPISQPAHSLHSSLADLWLIETNLLNNSENHNLPPPVEGAITSLSNMPLCLPCLRVHCYKRACRGYRAFPVSPLVYGLHTLCQQSHT